MEKGALERQRKERRLHIQANHSDTQTKTIFGMRNQIVIKINNEKKKTKIKTKKGKRNINLKKKREKQNPYLFLAN